ncbi:MAG: type II secretion system protein M [Treponemataceae bacterium]|nr:type II secretion system protein M [Treponemataceae bacterium]
MIKTIWENMTRTQRLYTVIGGATLACLILFQFVLFPFFTEKSRLKDAIRTNERILKELVAMGTEYTAQKRRIDEFRAAIARRPADFSLFAFLDKKAQEGGLKAHIKAMNPTRGLPVEQFEETAVEMKLEKITLKQLANYLYLVEQPQDYIRVKKMVVTKTKEAPEYLNATLLVATYQQEKRGGR